MLQDAKGNTIQSAPAPIKEDDERLNVPIPEEESLHGQRTNKRGETEPDWNEVEFPVEFLGPRICVRRSDARTKTDGGLYLPQSAQQGGAHLNKLVTAKVLKVGKGLMKADGEFVPMQIKKGDIVLIDQHRSATLLSIGGFDYFVMNESDVCGILDEGIAVNAI